MRIEADRDLSPSTVDAIRSLISPPPSRPDADDAALVRLALGDADAEGIGLCAQALLARPGTRDRLRAIRLRLSGNPGAGTAVERVVDEAATEATAIARLLAEGRWQDGSVRLAASAGRVRAGWTAAARLRDWGSVDAMAQALLPMLAETDVRGCFASLCGAARSAARGAGNPRLEAWVLSFEGASAAFRGDSDAAEALWRSRLELCRREGFDGAAADTLLDLAGLSRERGDFDAADVLLDEAERSALAAGSPDYLAAARSNRALLRLDRGDPEGAAATAVDALRELLGTGGDTLAVFVRLVAVRALVQARRDDEAIGAAADALEMCAEAGRPVQAARVLGDVAGILEARNRLALAATALEAAATALGSLGARGSERARERSDAFVADHGLPAAFGTRNDWHRGARLVLDALRENLGAAGAAR